MQSNICTCRLIFLNTCNIYGITLRLVQLNLNYSSISWRCNFILFYCSTISSSCYYRNITRITTRSSNTIHFNIINSSNSHFECFSRIIFLQTDSIQLYSSFTFLFLSLRVDAAFLAICCSLPTTFYNPTFSNTSLDICL